MEIRQIESPAQIEVRQNEDSSSTVSGYASVFYDDNRRDETEYQLNPDIVERIMPGAFTRTLGSDADVLALYQHDPSQPLARRSAGTLQLEADQRGLRFEMRLCKTQRAQDLVEDIRAGNIQGASFGFKVPRGGSSIEDGVREIRDCDLVEVSPVTVPAYRGTSIGLRYVHGNDQAARRALARQLHAQQLARKHE